jgi:hypothetical protein
MLAPSLSYAITSVRSCDENKSCIDTYTNGTQFVQLSTKKWGCITLVLKAVSESPWNSLNIVNGTIQIAKCLKTA